jgi:hypothetical protein
VIVHVKKGDTLPVEISASLPFAKLVAGENKIVVTQDVYIYIDRKSMLVGRDGTQFAPVYDMKGLKQIFGFKNGTLRVGFGMDKEGTSKLTVGVASQ